jgi:hypothetical protein
MNSAIHALLVLAALAILAYPVGMAVDAAYGQDVYLLSSVNDASTTETNRELFGYTSGGLEGDELLAAVVEIYGSNPKLEPERVLLFDDAAVIRPAELPHVTLLPAGSAGGAYPAQSQSLLYVTRSVTLAGFVAALILLVLRQLVLRKERTEPQITAS